MSRPSNRIPGWAIVNSVLLFAPIVLGLGAFNIWFVPNHAFRIPALLLLIAYYVAVYFMLKHNTPVSRWKNQTWPYHSWKGYLKASLGFVMFLAMAYFGSYAVAPALVTRLIGSPTSKQLTISSIDAVYRSGGCRYEIRFIDAPPPMGGGFCVRISEFSSRWAKGSKVAVYGYESYFGFRFTQIER